MLLCIAAGFVAGYFVPLPFFAGPVAIRAAVSSALIAAAAGIIFVSRRELVKNKEHPNPYRPTNAIVSSGIYGISRNPIYVAFMIVVVATAVAANNAWLFAAAAAAFLVLRFAVVRVEERYLLSKFGSEYDDYRHRVRRWL